jgi:hypothetical protein
VIKEFRVVWPRLFLLSLVGDNCLEETLNKTRDYIDSRGPELNTRMRNMSDIKEKDLKM